jgi:hypothetical protein
MQIRDAYAESKSLAALFGEISFLGRFSEIEKENRKLLNKMSEILGKTQPNFFHQSKTLS